MTSAEKFEILSAYLDDEASPKERRLVEQWIECDPLFRQQYETQLALKAAVRSLPTNLFDIAPEGRLASNQTTSESAHLESSDDLKPDRLSIDGKPMNVSGTAIAPRWRDLLIIATALSAAAFTTLFYGSIESSRKNQVRRPSGKITEVDASL